MKVIVIVLPTTVLVVLADPLTDSDAAWTGIVFAIRPTSAKNDNSIVKSEGFSSYEQEWY